MKKIQNRLDTLYKRQVRMAPQVAMLIASLLILFFVSSKLATIGWADGGTTVKIDPASRDVGLGSTATTDVLVEDVTNLYGFEFQITFDPTLVEVVDVNGTKDGVQIEAGDFLNPDWEIDNTIDNDNGTIDYALSQQNPSKPITGTGTLATITWRGKAVGTSPITLTQVLLGAPGGISITTGTQDGEITVVAASIGDRVWKDENGDGYQTGGGWDVEGFNGVEVYLFQDDGDGVFEPGTTGTDRDGNFLYVTTTISGTSQDNYPDGIYGFDISEYDQYWVWVNESTLPSGTSWVSTTDNPFYLDYPGGDDFSIDFGYEIGGGGVSGDRIGDRVWHDQDGDGYQTSGWDVEGFNDVDVYLYASDPGTSCGSGSPLAMTTTISGTSQTPDGFPDGIYEFNGVSLGLTNEQIYWVCVKESTLPSPEQGKQWTSKTGNPQSVTYDDVNDDFSIDFGYVATTGPTVVTLSSFAAKSSAGSEAPSVWLWLVGVAALAMGGVLWVRRRANGPGHTDY